MVMSKSDSILIYMACYNGYGRNQLRSRELYTRATHRATLPWALIATHRARYSMRQWFCLRLVYLGLRLVVVVSMALPSIV